MSTPPDDPALSNFRAIADAIATLFFPHAEVVLHDLRSQKIDYIANNLSKREIGDDAALEDMFEAGTDETNIGPYEKLNWDGQKIRSITGVLRDDAGLTSKRVTGVYDLRHPEAALRAVVQPHGGRVERYSAWVLVVR